MADVNAPSGQAPTVVPPVRTDDQILPHIRWVPIGKSNCYLDLDKSQSSPIYKIVVDLLKHTNFFRAFTTSSTIPSIYIQQLWDTIQYDKKAGSYRWKKRVTLIVIPSTWFTKLIIHHLQRRHKFHLRLDSSLHLLNKEPVLGYLKFSAKGTKREVFRMLIPGSLITVDIREASYYQEYLANAVKHRRYLAGETGSDPNSPAPKPTKPARKPKTTAPKAPPRPSRKKATETSDKLTKAKKFKYSVAPKVRKPRSSLKSVAALEAKDVPAMEPQVAAEDADLQKALEESMKTAYVAPWGPLPPMVIREPESGKYQPLLEVPEKGKAKVTEEQVAHDLLSLQKPQKKSPVDQYIFQRRNFTTIGSSGHDEPSYAELEQSKSEGIEKVVHGADEVGQGKSEGQAGPDPCAQAKGQTGSDAGTQDEGQAGSNPNEIFEGQAGPDPGNDGADVKFIPSPVVHAGSDREHMDLDVADVTPQPSTEQLDKGFTATAYPKVQENLKLTVEEQVLLEDPASSSGTLSSLQHLKTKVESMVSVTIQQDMSSIPPMTSPIIDLTLRPESPKVHQQFKATTTETTITTTTTLPPSPAQQQSTAEAMMMKRIVSEVVTDAVDWAMQAPLRNSFRDLPEADMKEILYQRMWETESYKTHEATSRKKRKKSRESPKTPTGSPPHQPPPPPLPAGTSGALGAPGASGSSQVPPPPPPPSSTNQENPSKGSAAPSPLKTAALAEYQAWTMTDIRLRLSISLTPVDLEMDEDMAPDEQVQSSDDEDIGSAHIPKVNLRQDWWKPLEEERPAMTEPAWSILSFDTGDIATFMNWFCKRRGITELIPQDLEGPAFEIIKAQRQQTITTSGPPGQVIIQSDFFFNKDLEYLRYGSKGSRYAPSISKMKATYYPNVGLEQMVPDQFWIDEECKYDIAAMYVRTHMWILSVVRIEVFSMYGYDYMKKILLLREDLNEHIIVERDFKYLYSCDFEDMYLLNLQGHFNHLPPKDKKILTTAVNQWNRHLVIRQRVKDFQLGIKSYQTQLNLTKPQWDATGFEYKHDYTVIDSPRAVMFRGRGSEQGIYVHYSKALEDKEDLSQPGELLTHKFNPSSHSRSLNRLLFHFSWSFMHFYRFSHSELVDIEKVAVCSSLRSLKPKLTIESRAKRSSKIISLGHYSIMLASSDTVKSKTDIKSPTHYPCGIAKTSE
nr:hypothetical protein [Tanacetum cinerariifolium]